MGLESGTPLLGYPKENRAIVLVNTGTISNRAIVLVNTGTISKRTRVGLPGVAGIVWLFKIVDKAGFGQWPRGWLGSRIWAWGVFIPIPLARQHSLPYNPYERR
jgi:hypothetical protein